MVLAFSDIVIVFQGDLSEDCLLSNENMSCIRAGTFCISFIAWVPSLRETNNIGIKEVIWVVMSLLGQYVDLFFPFDLASFVKFSHNWEKWNMRTDWEDQRAWFPPLLPLSRFPCSYWHLQMDVDSSSGASHLPCSPPFPGCPAYTPTPTYCHGFHFTAKMLVVFSLVLDLCMWSSHHLPSSHHPNSQARGLCSHLPPL